jgi:hypothetical protein
MECGIHYCRPECHSCVVSYCYLSGACKPNARSYFDVPPENELASTVCAEIVTRSGVESTLKNEFSIQVYDTHVSEIGKHIIRIAQPYHPRANFGRVDCDFASEGDERGSPEHHYRKANGLSERQHPQVEVERFEEIQISQFQQYKAQGFIGL